MPVEREFKYVLHDWEALWTTLTGMAEVGVIQRAHILQGYLSKGGRVRQRQWITPTGSLNSPEWFFTYKHVLLKKSDCLELEYAMSQEDYELAWEEADHKIDKTRFYAPDQQSRIWEIDFFRDPQGRYFAMAELEVAARVAPPDRLHPLVEEHLLFAVPEDDGRFKNRNLCERHLAEGLLKEIVSRDV